MQHLYLPSSDTKYIRLIYSVSPDSPKLTDESISKSSAWFANKFLHHRAILYFKSLGFMFYDLGGLSVSDNDAKLLNINRFKRSFGGCDVVFNYYPWLYSFVRYFYSLTTVFIAKLKPMLR